MPLYACEHCGFTSAAFRNDAAAAHRLAYPDCEGVVRIILRSDERYRGHRYVPADAGARASAPHSQASSAPSDQSAQRLSMREHPGLDGTLCLTLLGDLDVTAAGILSARLAELKTSGRSVRLDLSQLAFIDSSGIQALLVALTDARWTGWQLEVAPQVSPSVDRAARVVGIAQVLWPQHPDRDRTNAATVRPASTA